MANKTVKRATAKVFTTGRSQAIRIPKAYRFTCDEVLIERDGERVILTPARAPGANISHGRRASATTIPSISPTHHPRSTRYSEAGLDHGSPSLE